jgi:uncharacterized protein (DUF1800 family)
VPDPVFNDANVRHLLRRTEFVDRPARVNELMALGSMSAAVDNVMAVQANPPSVVFTGPADEDWQRGVQLTHFWLDRMAFDSPRPLQEKMSFFWHGHFCSEFSKVDSSEQMRQQIDLFRKDGLGNIRTLAKTMSLQVAMIRYLDNNDNRASSPNQNFARELMELFLLGVGNYTEADVEASALAWTGHSDQWDDKANPYRWRPEWHDGSAKTFLGRPINAAGTDPKLHGPETIDVMLGTAATVPVGPNVGRPTRDVAAEFLSKKLWSNFATDTDPPAGVKSAMRAALVDNNFEARPWVRAMLMHPDFYTDGVKAGLVRSPVEFVVALNAATGRRSADADVTWLMEGMGQRPLFPPNVSGWKPNGYWVNASAMESRARTVQHFMWRSMDQPGKNYWNDGDNGVIALAGGDLRKVDILAQNPDRTPVLSAQQLVDRMLDLTRLSSVRNNVLYRSISDATYMQVVDFAQRSSIWERQEALLLILLAPDMHVA